MSLCWLHMVFIYILQKLIYLYIPNNLMRCYIVPHFLISTLLDFTFISSLFSSQRTILVSIDGVQRALNLHVTTFFFLNVVAWWWVCTFLTNLLISGYFSSQVRHMCCTYQWTLSPCCRYSHQFLEHPLHELGHAYVPSLYFATLSCH